jgi:Protein of unknown function (DUF3303)
MKFMLTYTVPPATRDTAIARFLETRGQPPPGVRLLGRWTRVDLCGGVALLESEDPQALMALAQAWSDLLELTIAPVLEDRELSDVLQRASVQPGRVSAGGEGLPQAAAIVSDQELPEATPPGADQTGEAIPMPPPPAAPGGLEGEGEEPEPPETSPEDAPVVPETTPRTTKPPYEEIA